MASIKTYHHYSAAHRIHVRYYYDRWTWHTWVMSAVSAPNDEADQIGESDYQHSKPDSDDLESFAAGIASQLGAV